MRVVRALLIAALLFIVGCGGGEPAAESSDSPEATPAAEATESPTAASEEAEPTEASEEPTETAAEVVPAEELLVPPSGGYAYGKLPKAATKGLQQQLAGPAVEKIIGDFATRSITKGGKPVAVLFAMRFTPEATDQDKTGFVAGVAQGAGGKPKAAKIAGKQVVFIKGPTPVYVFPGEDYALLFFGQSKAGIKPAVAAVITGLDQ